MHDRSSRTGMRELTVRAMLHGAALGDDGDAGMATILASEIQNPLLSERAEQLVPAGGRSRRRPTR
jgi:hypothetical protein